MNLVNNAIRGDNQFGAKTVDTAVVVGNTSTQILPANRGRLLLTITNDSDEEIYLARGEEARMHEGIRLNGNGGMHELNQNNLYWGAISAICLSGNKNLCISYSE